MIIRATAIPLAYYPYSSTSRIVHWFTRHHGKISTLMKGAVRPKSRFIGEYELFGTSELLYFAQRPHALHTAKECALIHSRNRFRTDWRAMQTASYLTALFSVTVPVEAPQPGLFELLEELLDLSEEFGCFPQFMHWAELRFAEQQGHAPNLTCCIHCGGDGTTLFSAVAGGIVCPACAGREEEREMECPPDVLAILRSWQRAEQPQSALNTGVSNRQWIQLADIAGSFMRHHFNLNPVHRPQPVIR